jgi:hypothetical protein
VLTARRCFAPAFFGREKDKKDQIVLGLDKTSVVAPPWQPSEHPMSPVLFMHPTIH